MKNIKTYGFMHNNGDMEEVQFTDEQVKRGELRAHIEPLERRRLYIFRCVY